MCKAQHMCFLLFLFAVHSTLLRSSDANKGMQKGDFLFTAILFNKVFMNLRFH